MTDTPWPKAICFALISPPITLQSANQSLYTMFSLLHGLTTEAQGKQCVCSMRSNNNRNVYTVLFELLMNLEFLIFCFLNIPISMAGLSTFIILCVFPHFLISTCHTVIILFFPAVN